MELPKETRARIFSAADALYDQADRATFPTVDAVRKTAKCSMNDASTGMREWRRAQTAQATPVVVQVPAGVLQAHSAALAALWQQAQELANQGLQAAQAGWDAERAEAETLNRQMAEAFEAQALELQAAQERIQALETSSLQAVATARNAQQQASLAEQRSQEIERRATELRSELDHAHQEVTQGRALADQAREEAARLRGQVEAMQSQNAELTRALGEKR